MNFRHLVVSKVDLVLVSKTWISYIIVTLELKFELIAKGSYINEVTQFLAILTPAPLSQNP